MKWQEHTIDTGENYGSLKKRFNLLDIPYRIKRGNQKVEINVPGYISADELQRYFDKVEMTVSRVVDDRADAKRILEINGKKSIIYVGDRIFGSSDIKDAQVKFDAIGRPFMALSLRKPQDISRRLLVEINDETPQIVNIDNPGKMSKIKLYFDKTFHDMHVLRAQLLQPLHNIDFDL